MFVRVSRDTANTVYRADIIHRGEFVGYVVKARGSIDYKVYSGGLMVARGRTLEEVKADMREYLRERGR